MDWNICSVIRGIIPLSSSESMSAPCRRRLGKLGDKYIRSYHHREGFPTSSLTVGKNSTIVTVKHILRAERARSQTDAQRKALLIKLSCTPLTILMKSGHRTNQETILTSLKECLLLHPVVKNLVLLRPHRKHSIEGESILLRTLNSLCRSDMGCM